MSRRTSVLLGAGASFDAGLPLTFQLAEKVVSEANDHNAARSFRRFDSLPWVMALNFVYGAMAAHQSEDGGNPLAAVNIERLISALRLLQDVDSHEVAPFVQSWKPPVRNLGSKPKGVRPGRLGERLANSIGEETPSGRPAPFRGRDVEQAIEEIIEQVLASERGHQQVFKDAEDSILTYLARFLSEIQTVEYLSPIADFAFEQEGGLDIITLNYDLTIEQLVQSRAGLALETGIRSWIPGQRFNFESRDCQVNLLKLHGSLDWESRVPADPVLPIQVNPAPRGDDAQPALRHDEPRPWIVVGDREKLSTDGPTLHLMAAARDILQRTTNLVVVGYGFGDRHVNDQIRDWLASSESNTITVVDPSFPSETTQFDDFREAMLERYGADPANNFRTRLGVFREDAAAALGSALRFQHPEPVAKDDYFLVDSVKSLPSGFSEFNLTSLGPCISDLSISIRSSRPVSGEEVWIGTSVQTIEERKKSGETRGQWSLGESLSLGPSAQGQQHKIVFTGVDLEHARIEVHFLRSDACRRHYSTVDLKSLRKSVLE